MNGPLAQFVALTCHANAFLRGLRIPEFFSSNSTCQFCDWVKFFNVSRTLLGKVRQAEVATTPDQWFECLKADDVSEVRLFCAPQNDPGIPDRMSAASVGGGGTWSMKAADRKGKTCRMALKMGGLEPGRARTPDLAGFLRSSLGTPISIGAVH